MPAPWSSGAKLRIVGKLHGQDCINVLHFATNTQINDPTELNQRLQQLVTAMLECLVQLLPAAVTQDYTLSYVEAMQIHPTAGDVIQQAPAQPVVGQLGPTSVSFAASLVQVRTGFSSRTKRGRIFLPPVGEAQMTNSLIDAAGIDPITAFLVCVAGKFLTNNASSIWRMGVLSRKKVNNAAPAFNDAFTEALTLLPSNVVAKMGSRKVGHGS